MILLSDFIYSLICHEARPEAIDDAWILGCKVVGTGFVAKNSVIESDLNWQAEAIKNRPGFIVPALALGTETYRVQFFNDLYNPGWTIDEDRIVHFSFPVPIKMSLSSTFLSRDWRFIGLAAWAYLRGDFFKYDNTSQTAIFSAMDASGREVQALVERKQIEAFVDILKSYQGKTFADSRWTYNPGMICSRCTRSNSCPGLETYLEKPADGDQAELQPELRTQALFYQRMDIEAKLEVLEKRKARLDAELLRYCIDDEIRLGSGDAIKLPRRRQSHWNFSKVRAILESLGLWNDVFGGIKASALEAALPRFGHEVLQRVKACKTETLNEPSISEAVRHGKMTTGVINMRGLSK